MRTSIEDQQGPDAKTLAALGAIVLVGGLNFVAVRFSNRGLPPLFGAGFRFLIASLMLVGFVVVRKIPLPNRLQLKGTLIYGVLNFAISYAFAYLALVKLPSAVAAVIMGSVPLITLFLATLHGVERFRLRGLIGAAIAIGGIAVLVGVPSETNIAVGALLTMLGAAFGAAESGVVVKRFPTGHPVTTNAVGMLAGSVVLLGLSAAWQERWSMPSGAATWLALTYLIVMGSIAMFGFYLYALKRWTASGVSYMFVLTPIVASISGAVLAGEAITPTIVVGGSIVLAGVYIGALSHHPARKAPPKPEEETPAPPVEEAAPA